MGEQPASDVDGEKPVSVRLPLPTRMNSRSIFFDQDAQKQVHRRVRPSPPEPTHARVAHYVQPDKPKVMRPSFAGRHCGGGGPDAQLGRRNILTDMLDGIPYLNRHPSFTPNGRDLTCSGLSDAALGPAHFAKIGLHAYPTGIHFGAVSLWDGRSEQLRA